MHRKLAEQEDKEDRGKQPFSNFNVSRPITTAEGVRYRKQVGEANIMNQRLNRTVQSQNTQNRWKINASVNPYTDATNPASTAYSSSLERIRSVKQPQREMYSGSRIKVQDSSLMAQTLNKFEIGETDKKRLKSESGHEYFRKHI